VFKRWQVIDRREILFEQVHWPSVSALAEGLPKQARTASEPTQRVASTERRLPPRHAVARAEHSTLDQPTGGQPALDWNRRASLLLGDYARSDQAPHEPAPTAALAAAPSEVGHSPGLVLDYELVTGSTDFTFKGDTTYLVTGRVWLYGQTTFEGNAVIKFRVDNPSELPWLALAYGTVDCRTGPYRQVVFTAKDDNSVGEVIPGSTGNPSGYYAEYGLYVYLPSAAVELTHLQMRWFKLGLLLVGGSGHLVRHGQLVECAGALYASSTSFNAENLLMVNTHWRVAPSNPGSIQGAHWTVDRAGYPAQMNGGSLSRVNNDLGKEAGTQVDIGLHYVASVNGAASDSDGAGLPDYAEDHNGNNLVNGGETSPDDPDSDYDGRSDGQELAEGTDPLDSDSATETQLGWWRFNSTGWPGEAGQMPGSLLENPSAGRARLLPSRDGSNLATVFDGSAGASPYRGWRSRIRPKAFANVQAVASWSGTALQVNSASPANLK